VKDDDGTVHERAYKFNPPLVHRVLAPGEEPPARHRKGTKASSKEKSKH